jgi:sialate O-acetylesterase
MRTLRERIALIMLATGLVATGSWADVKLPAVIGDHMVLQQGRPAHLWGWADPGETINVKADWSRPWDSAGLALISTMQREPEAATTADADGRWQVWLDTPSPGGPYTASLISKTK